MGGYPLDSYYEYESTCSANTFEKPKYVVFLCGRYLAKMCQFWVINTISNAKISFFGQKKGVLGSKIMGICGIFFSSSNSREFPYACLHKPNQKCPCGKKTEWPTPITPFFDLSNFVS